MTFVFCPECAERCSGLRRPRPKTTEQVFLSASRSVMLWGVDEFFPSVERLKANVRAAQERPEKWREENLRMVREFFTKMDALGVAPPGSRHPQVRGWRVGNTGILHPGPPARVYVLEYTSTYHDGVSTGGYGFAGEVGLDEWTELGDIEPQYLNRELTNYLPP